MKIERTKDVALIERIFKHPEIINDVSNGNFEVNIDDSIYWLMAYTDVLVGCIVFFPIYGIACNPHIAILPEHRGCGTEVMRSGIEWIFDNTPYRKIIAFPFKPIMRRVYEKCGFTVEGFSKKLLDVRGILTDCYIVGYEK